ncbi:Hypp7337 [Branchiostoma lanceolatum]|uniref:Hypp7337 protein n=1 Tax=Branchiostoma lanceolatum TaxID=7740 RepID=A0A8J9YZ51_BRALA|nr:Hypp7337 [Branchiostoma lanceolatum]
MSLYKFSYTLPGRSGWPIECVMKHLRKDRSKAINVDMFFQEFAWTRSGKKKRPLQHNSRDTASSKRPKRAVRPTVESSKEKEKAADEILRQLFSGDENEESEDHIVQTETPAVLQMHSYSSSSQSKAPSTFNSLSFQNEEALLPEELVLYGLLYVMGTAPHEGRKDVLPENCFTPWNSREFVLVATALNRITGRSQYSADGINLYLSSAPQPKGRCNKVRWVHFQSEVQQFVEQQEIVAHLSGHEVDAEGPRCDRTRTRTFGGVATHCF